MKQKLKKLKLLLTISLAGLLLNSCQEEFDDNYNESKNTNFVKEFTFKQASQKPKFNNAYHKFASGLDKMKSTNKSTDSDFTIDSTTVKEITLGNLTTYTMAIKRPIPNNNYFENLIIQVKTGDSTRAYITKYTPNQEMVYFQAHNSFDFHGTTQIKEIVFDSSLFQGKKSTICYTVLVCDWDHIHIAGAGCTGNISSETYCYDVGDEGIHFNYGGGSGSSSSGGSSGGVPTAPVPPPPCTRNCPEFNDPNTPCAKLQKQLETPAISNALSDLRNNVHLSGETAFSFNRNTNGQVAATPQTNSSGNNASIKITNTTFGIAHTHQEGPVGDPSDLFPMLAPMDLMGIANAIYGYSYLVLGDTPFFFNMMVVNGVTYAVTPDSPNDFVNINALYDTEKMERMNRKLENIFKAIDPNIEPHLVNKDKLAKAFLEFMNSTNNPAGTNFNVSLYKIDDFDLASKRWSKVELDPTKPNGVKHTPCN